MFGLDAILLCRASFGRSLNGVSALCSFVRSAVDTVATLAILGSKDVNVDPMLFSIVFGESGACVRRCSPLGLCLLRLCDDFLTRSLVLVVAVINDAVCIVLFDSLHTFGDSFNTASA